MTCPHCAEASEALAVIYVMLTGAEPMWDEMPWDERCARAANEAIHAHERLEAAVSEKSDSRGDGA